MEPKKEYGDSQMVPNKNNTDLEDFLKVNYA
jgi:hypothetical protein